MSPETQAKPNVKQAVPFFLVSNLEASLRYYIGGLGFTMTLHWIDEGKLLGEGVSICFLCEDALAIYRDVTARGIPAGRPFVGNGMWVTSLSDPDGYRLDFESETDSPEETALSEEEQESQALH